MIITYELLSEGECARCNAEIVGEEFHTVVAGSKGGVDVPIDFYAGNFLAGVFYCLELGLREL